MDHTASTSNGTQRPASEQSTNSGPRVSTLLRLVGLMGRETFTAWTEQVRDSGGHSPTRSEVEDMLAICGAYGEEEFRRMVQAEYCGGSRGGEGGGSIIPATPAAVNVAAVTMQAEPLTQANPTVAELPRRAMPKRAVRWEREITFAVPAATRVRDF
jgi:hypothetical protein